MSYFFWGMLLLFAATLIYYLVFFLFVYYWHEKNITFVIVPLIYTFEFFLTAFLIISIVVLFLQYVPALLTLIGK